MKLNIFFIVLLVFSTATYYCVENEPSFYTLATCKMNQCSAPVLAEEGALTIDQLYNHLETYHEKILPNEDNFFHLQKFFSIYCIAKPIYTNVIVAKHTRKDIYFCAEHNKSYDFYSSMSSHLKSHHNITEKCEDYKLHICTCNPAITYSSEEEFRQHVFIHITY